MNITAEETPKRTGTPHPKRDAVPVCRFSAGWIYHTRDIYRCNVQDMIMKSFARISIRLETVRRVNAFIMYRTVSPSLSPHRTILPHSWLYRSCPAWSDLPIIMEERIIPPTIQDKTITVRCKGTKNIFKTLVSRSNLALCFYPFWEL